ncbi:MAG: hypothetical protein KDD33_12300 [Bdellovibrionales bacterium]|nr:hypothetical protein [Bdellovibrionales bacterium]
MVFGFRRVTAKGMNEAKRFYRNGHLGVAGAVVATGALGYEVITGSTGKLVSDSLSKKAPGFNVKTKSFDDDGDYNPIDTNF